MMNPNMLSCIRVQFLAFWGFDDFSGNMNCLFRIQGRLLPEGKQSFFRRITSPADTVHENDVFIRQADPDPEFPAQGNQAGDTVRFFQFPSLFQQPL